MADSYLNLILRASKTGTGAADARRELQELAREQQNAQRAGVQAERAYLGMAQSLAQNASMAGVTSQAINRLNTHLGAGRITTQQYEEATKAAMLQSGQMTTASLHAADQINVLNSRYAGGQISAQQYAQGLRGIQTELQNSQGFMERYGAAVRAVAVVSLGALALGFASVSSAAMKFEADMNVIVALTNTTKAEIGGMTTAVLNMAREVGRSPDELAKGLYFVASSGFAGSQGLKVLEASAKASAAGLGETKTIADAVTSTLNAYKMGVDQASHVTDVLINIVKEGKGEPTAFAGALGRILPIASAAGVSFEQVGASMATMTRIGLSAEEAATALRGTLNSLIAPGKAATDALNAIGLSTDDVRKSIRDRGLLVTLQDLMTRTHGNIETLEAIIPNVRALTGVLATAGSQGEAYAQIMAGMSNVTGETERAFKTASETMQFKANQVSASFDALKISVGNALLPTLKSLMDSIKGVIDSFLALDPHTQQFITSMGVIALSTAPAMVAIDKVGKGIKGLGTSFKDFSAMREEGKGLFQSLSALRGIEFGVLIAGLAVIVTYLGRVSEAANKSTEDLIKMSHSGDLLDRAAAATEILTHGQERLKVALDAAHIKITTGSKTYAEYRSAIDATAKAAGYEIDAQGNLTSSIDRGMGAGKEMIQVHYAMTEAQYAGQQASKTEQYGIDLLSNSMLGGTGAAKDMASANQQVGITAEQAAAKQRDLAQAVAIMTAGYGSAVSKEMKDYNNKQVELKEKAAELAKQIRDLQATQGAAVTTTSKHALTANEAALAQIQLAKAERQLNDETAKGNITAEQQAALEAQVALNKGKLDGVTKTQIANSKQLRAAQDALKNAQFELNNNTNPEKQMKLAVQVDNLKAKLGQATGAVGAYVDNSKKIGELQAEYDKVTKAINENVAAHDEAMKRIVLDIAQQQLAQDGWTNAEIAGFTTVAVKMGVFDQTSADLTANILKATGQLATDQNPDTFANNLQSALDQANAAAQQSVEILTGLGKPIDVKGFITLPPVQQADYLASLNDAQAAARNTVTAIDGLLTPAEFAQLPPVQQAQYVASLNSAQTAARAATTTITQILSAKEIAQLAPVDRINYELSLKAALKDAKDTTNTLQLAMGKTTLPPMKKDEYEASLRAALTVAQTGIAEIGRTLSAKELMQLSPVQRAEYDASLKEATTLAQSTAREIAVVLTGPELAKLSPVTHAAYVASLTEAYHIAQTTGISIQQALTTTIAKLPAVEQNEYWASLTTATTTAQNTMQSIYGILSQSELAKLSPVQRAEYDASLQQAFKLAQDTGISIAAAFRQVKLEKPDSTLIEGSLKDIKNRSTEVTSALATDPNIPLFAKLFNVNGAAIQTDSINMAKKITSTIPPALAGVAATSIKTAATVATTLPPVLSGLAFSTASRVFAGNFQTSMGVMVTAAQGGTTAGLDLYNVIESLHSKDITITTTYKTVGKPPEGTPAPNKPGGAQYGGSIMARTPTLVGETGPELFIPASNGNVLNHEDTRRLLQALEAIGQQQAAPATIARGGDTIIINDRLALASYYDQRRRAQIDRINARMGG